MEHRSSRRPRAVRLTDRDRELLSFLSYHRLAHAGHVAALLHLSEGRAGAVLARLVEARYVRRETVFDRRRFAYLISRKGVEVIGSELRPPRPWLREYEHDVGVAWLWLGARAGAFGPVREVFAERQLRSHDEAPARAGEPLSVRLGGVGPGGRERLHYPDLLVVRTDGRRVAVELELSAKGRTRLERILAGYGADRRIDAVLYLVPNRTAGKAVVAAAHRLGLESLVHVQLARQELRKAPRSAARTLERAAERPGERAARRPRERAGERGL